MTTHDQQPPARKPGGAERQFQLLVESINDYAIFMLDPSGRIATWNAGAQRIKGYSPDEVIGRELSIFYTPEDAERGRPQALLEIARTEGRVEDEGWRVRKDGSRFWADVVITALRDEDGTLQGFAKITRDLTARRQATEDLKRSEESLSATLYSIGDAVLAADERARITRINPVAERLTGWSEQEAIGRSLDEVFNIINEDTRAKAINPVSRVLAEGVVVGLANHTALLSRDGTERPIADSGAPIRDMQGRTRGAVLVFRDVTEERRAEEALRKSEESLSATLYSIGDGVLATDAQGRVTRINPVAERLTGWPENEAIGRPIEEVFNIINEESRAKAANPVTRVLREGVVVGLANHTALIARDGTERPIADSGAPIRDTRGKTRGAVLVFRDVTEERASEEALRQSKERLSLMIASVADYAIFMLDPAGRVASWNPGAERIKGYSETEILGEHLSKFFPPEEVAKGKPERELELAASQGRFEDEAWRVRKDGTRFWANIVISPMRDAANRLVGFVKVTRDLTDRRKMEDERLRLVQANEAIRLRDEFLSIASHELKTPLTALQLQLQSIRDGLAAKEDPTQKVERAMRSGDRLAQLIEALLNVSRIATGQLTLNPESFDLVEAAREVVERLHDGAASAGVELTLTAEGPLLGQWDRLRVEQILMNLLSNTFKYAAGKPVQISTFREGNEAVLEVCDNGPGIPEADLQRIFGRFERATSTRHFGGMGLGLYVARQIAEAHHGSVVAENRPEGGACFTVRLPLG